MLRWELEGRTIAIDFWTAIVPFWLYHHRLLYSSSALLVLNGTSLNSTIMPFWLSTDDVCSVGGPYGTTWTNNLNVQKLIHCYLILKLLDSMHRHGWPFHSKHFENEQLFVKYCIPREFLKVSSQILSKQTKHSTWIYFYVHVYHSALVVRSIIK